jgi:replicative DNA helicase
LNPFETKEACSVGKFEMVKAVASLRDYADQHLTKSAGGMYCCPICGSGTHGTASSDGALSVTPDGTKWRCFSCGSGGDVFDLAGAVLRTEDRREQLEAVASWAHVPLDNDGRPHDAPVPYRQKGPERAGAAPGPDYSKGREEEAAYIERARANVGAPEAVAYLASRGLTEADAAAAGLGFDAHRHRLVIPWPGCDWYHADRDVTGRAKAKYLKPSAGKVGPQPLYNPGAASAEAFFIVEGALDAVAVSLCGFEAVAVASNVLSERNLSQLAAGVRGGGDGAAVVMLDNDRHGMGYDERGVSRGAQLVDALRAAGVPCIAWEPGPGDPKDAAEWLERDREGLRAVLSRLFNEAVQMARKEREEAYSAALRALRVVNPLDVASGIYAMEGFEDPTPTGIGQLDRVLDGGMRPGLYALGALSSMGKTTLAVQIADHMAANGRGVLFVTIEQSARELEAKSLARIMRKRSGDAAAASASDITSRARREAWPEAKNAALLDACDAYAATVAPRLRILEGTRQPTVSDVAAAARMMADHDGRAPVVFIDYLQLLAPAEDRDTDKQAVDRNVMALRQMARDMRAPVFAISSLNRSSYSEGVTLDSFKESGAIEYGCDVLMGLQPAGMRERLDKAPKDRQKREADKLTREHKSMFKRPCELVVLKNRNGATPNDGIPLTFLPLSAIYIEGAAAAVVRPSVVV